MQIIQNVRQTANSIWEETPRVFRVVTLLFIGVWLLSLLGDLIANDAFWNKLTSYM